MSLDILLKNGFPVIRKEDISSLLKYSGVIDGLVWEFPAKGSPKKEKGRWTVLYVSDKWREDIDETGEVCMWHCHGIGQTVSEALEDMNNQVINEALRQNNKLK